jgi:phage-related protein
MYLIRYVNAEAQDWPVVEIKKLPAAFYCTAAGREPVREWLKGLDETDRRTVGQDIATAEFGWPVGMPVCGSLGNGLYEIRSDISHGRITRVIFGVADEQMVLLHGFIKKTQRTPKADLDLALKRKKELTT